MRKPVMLKAANQLIEDDLIGDMRIRIIDGAPYAYRNGVKALDEELLDAILKGGCPVLRNHDLTIFWEGDVLYRDCRVSEDGNFFSLQFPVPTNNTAHCFHVTIRESRLPPT
jgi:hypothetical protein